MLIRAAIAFAALLAAVPAAADVHETAELGFVLRHGVEVKAAPSEVWQLLIEPAQWWNAEHSFSGDASNLSLEVRAGGCFCEAIPATDSAGGSVEHMRVLYAEPDRALRMSGALGPLQAEAVKGILTIYLRRAEGGTLILWEYVVGGYMRGKAEEFAPAVDRVLAEQLSRLSEKLGPKPLPESNEADEAQTPRDPMIGR